MDTAEQEKTKAMANIPSELYADMPAIFGPNGPKKEAARKELLRLLGELRRYFDGDKK